MDSIYCNPLNQKLDTSRYPSLPVLPLVKLPVMDALLNEALKTGRQGTLKKTAIYYVHHALRTSVNVIDAIIKLGAKPNNVFILGKSYSECDAVVSSLIQLGVHYQPCSMQTSIGSYSYAFIRDINWLWARLIDTIGDDVEEIMILDHGGHAISYFPLMLLEKYKIVGIEKTTAGFMGSDKNGLPPIPLIDVANSAAKRFVESPLIASAVVNKIASYLPKNKEGLIFGVVGLGSIGKAVANRLRLLGCRLIVHDINSDQMKFFKEQKDVLCTNDLSALISASDYIFGCSGRDVSERKVEQFLLSSRNKTLISCSSEDKEFLSLLRFINQDISNLFDPLNDIDYKTNFGATIRILRGGFPVNFDNTGESVPDKDIQLTRSLVLGAIIQASTYFKDETIKNRVYPLDSSTQQFIVQEWLKHQDNAFYCDDMIRDFFVENAQ